MIMNRILSIAILFILAFNVSYSVDKKALFKIMKKELLYVCALHWGGTTHLQRIQKVITVKLSMIGLSTEFGSFASTLPENPFRYMLIDTKNARYLVYAALYTASLNILIAS